MLQKKHMVKMQTFHIFHVCYTMAFFQASPKTIKKELMQTFQRFNATFVALIPKRVGANYLRDFRPIILIFGIYKIIANVLAERLKKVISRVVSNHQMTFTKGRQIMDDALSTSECIHTSIRGDVPGVMCKLGTVKAFNHLNWSFLLNTLKQMGFGRYTEEDVALWKEVIVANMEH